MAFGQEIARAFVTFESRESPNFRRNVVQGSERVGREGGRKFGGVFASAAGKALSLAGGIFAATQIVKFFADSTRAAEEAASAQAASAQIIKQTGGAANVTAGQVEKLTGTLQQQTGVDQELIQAGSNILLTFKNIANQQGRNNDIFDRANAIMLDVAAVTGQDATSSATQLGKALNDPVKGITALQRVGVSFTEQQREQVKALVESGDTLGAQKLILAELESQYGGTAAATADDSAKIAVAFDEIKERVGGFLLPVLARLADFMFDTLLPAMERVGEVVGPAVARGVELARGAFESMRPAIEPVIKFISRVAERIVGLFGGGGDVPQALDENAAFFRDTWGQIVAVVSDEIELLQAIIKRFVEAATAFWDRWGATITKIATNVWNAVKEIIRGVLNAVRGIIQTVTGLITGDWNKAWEGIKLIVDGVWDAIFGLVRGALRSIRDLIVGALEGIAERWRIFRFVAGLMWKNIGREVTQTVKGWIDSVVTFFREMPARITSAMGDIAGRIKDKFSSLLKGFSIPIKLAFGLGGDGLGVGPTDALPGRGAFGVSLSGLQPALVGAAHLAGRLGASITSALRPGSRTLSGNLSYHASGRAIDTAPIRAVALAFRRIFGGRIKELITPWPDLNMRNGRPFRYSAAIQAQHSGRNAHNHLALHQGGLFTRPTFLPAGATIAERETEVVSPVSTMEDTFAKVLAAHGRRLGGPLVHIGQMAVMDPQAAAAAVARELAYADLVAEVT